MVEKIFVDFVLVVYLITIPYFFTIWLTLFQRDSSLSSLERYLSWVILVVATIFWPIAVPLAYLELLSKHNPS
jgi:hypothetical protein